MMELSERGSSLMDQSNIDHYFKALDEDGIVVLPNLLSPEQLRRMQVAFEAQLRRLRWNNFDGYQKTEPYRHMVEDVLLIVGGQHSGAFAAHTARPAG